MEGIVLEELSEAPDGLRPAAELEGLHGGVAAPALSQIKKAFPSALEELSRNRLNTWEGSDSPRVRGDSSATVSSAGFMEETLPYRTQSDAELSIMGGVQRQIQQLELASAVTVDSDAIRMDGESSSGIRGSATFAASALSLSSAKVRREDEHMSLPAASAPIIGLMVGLSTLMSVSTSACIILLVEDIISRTSWEIEQPEEVATLRARGLIVCAALSFVAIALCSALGFAVAWPLRRLADQIQSLSARGLENVIDADERSPHILAATPGASWIADVQRLQVVLAKLQSNIATFECFLPETVVRRIVRGDQIAKRLHVDRRIVSIMFSDVKDFTSITESLKPRELLLLLTRYLDVMSRIAHSFDGVVAEILGDGLLVFWNTPDDVADHGPKAVATALAQHHALGPLNTELQAMRLPQLSIRVGLHRGTVLTGNIGSLSKMKFGCMGDAVNLAARLESLCKLYKISVMCSGAMYRSIEGQNLFCRKLDIVRVQGKQKPTHIYEVLGIHHGPAIAIGDTPTLPSTAELPMSTALSEASLTDVVKEALAISSDQMGKVHGSAWIDSMMTAAKRLSRVSEHSGLHSDHSVDGTPTSRSSPREHRKADSKMSALSIEEPLRVSLAEPVTSTVRSRAGVYEEALQAFQAAKFMRARDLLEGLLRDPDGAPDGAADLLLKRTRKYIGADGQSLVGISSVELQRWDGIHNLSEK